MHPDDTHTRNSPERVSLRQIPKGVRNKFDRRRGVSHEDEIEVLRVGAEEAESLDVDGVDAYIAGDFGRLVCGVGFPQRLVDILWAKRSMRERE